MIRKGKIITNPTYYFITAESVEQQGIKKHQERTQPNNDKRTFAFSGYNLHDTRINETGMRRRRRRRELAKGRGGVRKNGMGRKAGNRTGEMWFGNRVQQLRWHQKYQEDDSLKRALPWLLVKAISNRYNGTKQQHTLTPFYQGGQPQ